MAPGFGPTSRYATTGTATWTGADGREIVYLRRRFVPQPDRFALLRTHTVAEGERPDTVAAGYLGDPEQFWRIADANRVLRPDELAEVGRVLRITLPDGVPGTADA